MKRISFLILCLTCALACYAQNHLLQGTEYEVSAIGMASRGKIAPFWFTNNRYGQGATDTQSALFRAGLHRDAAMDSLQRWRIGYGADVIGGFGIQSHIALQQLYADFEFKAGRLCVGQKERDPELKNPELSMGGLTLGRNARPLPQVRLELPDFWTIPGTQGWLGIRGHLAYGWYTDGQWQETHNRSIDKHLYTTGSRFHSKAGFLRFGDFRRFPLAVTGGLEMATQFGGTVYNALGRDGKPYSTPQHLSSGLKDYWNALSFSGSDINDGEGLGNVAGNTLGSWHLRLDYQGHGWGASAYAEHFFEDHSQMFVQYGWKDMLYGLEVQLPHNPFVSHIVYEHLGMMHQSGPVYHDHTDVVPEQISGVDNYYGHHIYGSWQHGGFVMGNPLILSPIYNNMGVSPAFETEGSLRIFHSRIRAHHFALSGNPHRDLHYRILYTYQRSHGTYGAPTPKPVKGQYLLVEGTYSPQRLKGLSLALAYGLNGGDILGKSHGIMLTVSIKK